MTIDNTPVTVSAVANDPPVNSHIQFDMLLSSTFLKKRMKEQYNFDIDSLWVGGWPNTYIELSDPAKWKITEKQINEVAAKFEEKDWKENKMHYDYSFNLSGIFT
jgi:hypothetical protein